MKKALQDIRQHTSKKFLWENALKVIFSRANPYWLTHIVEPLQLHICYDISHAFMSFRGDNDKLAENLQSAIILTLYKLEI